MPLLWNLSTYLGRYRVGSESEARGLMLLADVMHAVTSQRRQGPLVPLFSLISGSGKWAGAPWLKFFAAAGIPKSCTTCTQVQ